MKILIEFESDDIQPDYLYEADVLRILKTHYKGKFNVVSKRPTGDITFDMIEKSVCKYVDCNPEELQKKTRKRDVVEARQICHYLSRNAELGTLSSIGFRFGRKDHATCLYSIRTVSTLLKTDKPFQDKYKPLIESFNGS